MRKLFKSAIAALVISFATPVLACHAQIVGQTGWICLEFNSMIDLVNAIQQGSVYGDLAAEVPASKIVPIINPNGSTNYDFVFDSPHDGANFEIAFLNQRGIFAQVCNN